LSTTGEAAPAFDERNAASATRDHARAGGEQRSDGGLLQHGGRPRRGDDAPPAARHRRDLPVALSGEALSLVLGVDQPDGFGGVRRRLPFDDDVRDNTDHGQVEAAAAQRAGQRQREDVPRLALRLGNAHVQRRRRDGRGRSLVLEEARAHLRAVPVDEHQTLALGEQACERRCERLGVGGLPGEVSRVVRIGEGVASDRNDPALPVTRHGPPPGPRAPAPASPRPRGRSSPRTRS
jgi:hypothetical protein